MEESNNKVETQRAMYAELGLTLQPFILQAGQVFLVVIDQYRWPYDNVIKALDVCFKLTQVS